MSDRVDMIHPLLPGRVIHPKANKANAYLAGGWELKPETPAETPDPESTPAEKPEPRKRRSDATEKKEA